MSTEKDIIKQLHTLQSVKASDSLRSRIHLVHQHLPEHRHSIVPLVAFRAGIVVAMLILFVGGSSALAAAAQRGIASSILFQMKKAVVQAEIAFTHDPVKKHQLESQIALPMVIPSVAVQHIQQATPKPTQSPSAVPTKVQSQDEHKDDNKKDVKGISTTSMPTPTVIVQKPLEEHSRGNGYHMGWNFFLRRLQGKKD